MSEFKIYWKKHESELKKMSRSLALLAELDRLNIFEKKKIGRPKAQDSRYRAWVWYWTVKARRKASDYELDGIFGARDGKDRLRIFETIRAKGTLPGGTSRKRDFDLIARVEEHPNHPEYRGTRSVFDSPFWELLADRQGNLRSTHAVILKCLRSENLVRLDSTSSALLNFQLMAKEIAAKVEKEDYSQAERYVFVLTEVLEQIKEPLNGVTLLGALYREAFLACCIELAYLLSRLFLDRLAAFCRQPHLKRMKGDLFDFASARVMYWQFASEPVVDIYPDGPQQGCLSFIVPKAACQQS